MMELVQPNLPKQVLEFRSGLAEMIGLYGPWDTFCTWTFRPKYDYKDDEKEVPLYGQTAQRHFLKVMNWPCFRKTGWMFVVEPHKNRKATHVHSLHRYASHITWKLIWGFWYEKYGRFQSEKVRRDRGAGYYMGKEVQWSYMSKTVDDGLWGFSPFMKYARHCPAEFLENEHCRAMGLNAPEPDTLKFSPVAKDEPAPVL